MTASSSVRTDRGTAGAARPDEEAASHRRRLPSLGAGSMDRMQLARDQAAAAANAVDAALWRWLSALLDERRIRWCHAAGNWLVSVDHRHVATESTFDDAIRTAKANAERNGLDAVGEPDAAMRTRSRDGSGPARQRTVRRGAKVPRPAAG
ncbi:hypothetical protein [Burkholderia sp. PU8-34]